MTEKIEIMPLGAGQQVGRSCVLVKMGDKTVVFDCGIHMLYSDHQRYPDFNFILEGKNINQVIDLVIITHFHLDHCGALPFLTEHHKYSGPIYATTPTKAMIPYMLEDFRKVTTDAKKDEKQFYIYTQQEVLKSVTKINSIALQQTKEINGIKITPYYAGHVLGAAMFFVQYAGLSVLYTGDFNSYADRHLGAAYAPRLNPNIIITETTYATTIRDTKRDRERKMLKIVTETIDKGGRVLIPVFALGRAQELAVLLETYWNRTENQTPIYFSGGLVEKANFYYKLFVEWENEKIKEEFLTDSIFNFKKVKVFDKSLIRADSPYVLFATPGMLHGGTSMQVFKEWCGNPKNTIIIPGYCVAGTLGNKLLNGFRSLEIDKKLYEVNMRVENISFSAHADAKGIISMIRHVNAESIVFVHGDKQKMETFAPLVEEQFGKTVYRPANKETIQIPCTVRKSIIVEGAQEPPPNGYLIKNKMTENYRAISNEELLQEINLHQDLLAEGFREESEGIIVNDWIETELEVSREVGDLLLSTSEASSKLIQVQSKVKKLEEENDVKIEEEKVIIKGEIKPVLRAICQANIKS